MKKGFILALLVVAMVALVLPAGARAPIIKALPTIIVGDNEGAAGGKGIIRYPDALDLKSKSVVDWNNDESYTSDTFHAYLFAADTAPATDVVAYDGSGIIGTLSQSEYDTLVSVGAIPAPDTRITSYTSPTVQNFGLSLFDAGRHPAITDPASADPATQGETQDTYLAEVAMKLVCGVTSGSKLVVSQANLAVKCQSTAADAKEATFTEVASYSFQGSNDGWAFTTGGGDFTAATPTTAGVGSTGIGFVVSSPIVLTNASLCMYSTWMSPTNIPATGAQAGKVYRATAALESTAAAATAPGFRLRFVNTGFTHTGNVICESSAAPLAGDILNMPYAGSPVTSKVFWAPHPDLGDMSDTEGQALLTGDWRTYKVAWEIIGWTGEQGTLTMEAFFVESFARPATATKAVAWGTGTGEIAFNAADAAGGWTAPDNLPGSLGFTHGTATPAGGNVVLNVTGAEKTLRYVGVKTHFLAFDINLKPVSNHLYRFSATAACGSRTAVPAYRVVINSQIKRPADSFGVARNISWKEWFSFVNLNGVGGKLASFKPTGQTVCPFAPATTGSVIDVYVYSHAVADTTAGTTVFVPILCSVDGGVFGTGTQWPDANTPMTWSAASWEDLGADY